MLGYVSRMSFCYAKKFQRLKLRRQVPKISFFTRKFYLKMNIAKRLAKSHVTNEKNQLRKPIHLKYYIKLLMQNESFVELKLRITQRRNRKEIFASLRVSTIHKIFTSSDHILRHISYI